MLFNIQKQANSFFGSEYRVNVLERIAQVEKQAREGASEEAPVIFGRQAFIEKAGAEAAYEEALKLHKKNDNTVSSKLLARYASSLAGKEKRFEIRSRYSSNPVALMFTFGILIPIVGFLSAIPLFLNEAYKIKDEANKAKAESLAQYPDRPKNDSKTKEKSVSNEKTKDVANWSDKVKANAKQNIIAK